MFCEVRMQTNRAVAEELLALIPFWEREPQSFRPQAKHIEDLACEIHPLADVVFDRQTRELKQVTSLIWPTSWSLVTDRRAVVEKLLALFPVRERETQRNSCTTWHVISHKVFIKSLGLKFRV